MLEGLRRGLTYQQVADELGLSYETVKYHVSNMLSKAQVGRREDLVAFAAQPGMRWTAVPVALALAGGALATAAFLAFGVLVLMSRGVDNGGDPASFSATPVTTVAGSATPALATLPPPPTTGVAIVDQFIAAALSGDATKLGPLMDYQPIACSIDQHGIGAPPSCPTGEPDGSAVGAIFVGSCEGGYVSESEMPGLLSRWNLGFDSVWSASLIQSSGSAGLDSYAVILTFKRWADGAPTRDPRPGLLFSLSSKGVTRWSSGCAVSARALSLRYASYLIPPPPLQAPPAGTPSTGIAVVDAIINALVVRDIATLAQRTSTTPVGCGTDRWLPRCPGARPNGTLVDAVIREGCERTWTDYSLGEDYDLRIGPKPTVVAVAVGDGSDGVTYWIVFSGSDSSQQRDGGRALGVTDGGQIAVINGGCSQSAEELAKTFGKFVIAPR